MQFPLFTLHRKRFMEMQFWTKVLFNSGINILKKAEGAQKTTTGSVIPLQQMTTQAFLSLP